MELKVDRVSETRYEGGEVIDKVTLKSEGEGDKWTLTIEGDAVGQGYEPGQPYKVELTPLQKKLTEQDG